MNLVSQFPSATFESVRRRVARHAGERQFLTVSNPKSVINSWRAILKLVKQIKNITLMPANHSSSEATAAQVRAQRDRILESKIFSLSKRQSAFLDYVINAGLEEVAFNAEYPLGDVSLSLLREAGMKLRQVALPGA